MPQTEQEVLQITAAVGNCACKQPGTVSLTLDYGRLNLSSAGKILTETFRSELTCLGETICKPLSVLLCFNMIAVLTAGSGSDRTTETGLGFGLSSCVRTHTHT